VVATLGKYKSVGMGGGGTRPLLHVCIVPTSCIRLYRLAQAAALVLHQISRGGGGVCISYYTVYMYPFRIRQQQRDGGGRGVLLQSIDLFFLSHNNVIFMITSASFIFFIRY
jgi:hypothetical protein